LGTSKRKPTLFGTLFLERNPTHLLVRTLCHQFILAEKKPVNSNAVENIARYKRAQRCSVFNERAQVAKEKEKENTCKSIQQPLKAFEHDHGSYCKARQQQSSETVEQIFDFHPVRQDTVSQFPSIPAEFGKLNLANDDVAL